MADWNKMKWGLRELVWRVQKMGRPFFFFRRSNLHTVQQVFFSIMYRFDLRLTVSFIKNITKKTKLTSGENRESPHAIANRFKNSKEKNKTKCLNFLSLLIEIQLRGGCNIAVEWLADRRRHWPSRMSRWLVDVAAHALRCVTTFTPHSPVCSTLCRRSPAFKGDPLGPAPEHSPPPLCWNERWGRWIAHIH